jgi:hypothetical protein
MWKASGSNLDRGTEYPKFLRCFPSVTRNNTVILVIGIQLGPLGTAATNRPIVPTPGDYDDGEFGGMMIGREN